MQSLESRLNRVPLLRKSDNLSIREILAMTSVYELPSVQTLGRGKGGSPTGGGCVIFSWQENERFGYPRLFWRIIAWPCCGELTAVKTGYPLTSITWPYRGLRSWLIEFACFLKLSADKLVVFKWSQAGFHLFKCTGNKVCLWAALWKFWFQTDFRSRNSDSFYRQGSKRQLALPSMVTLYVECLSPVGQDLTGVHLENLCSISKLFYW